jgi:DNA gyrase subunit A
VFDLSDLQAEYILELRLRRLTKFSILELEQEADVLNREIAELEEILGSDEKLRQVIASELKQVANDHGTPRRTQLIDASGMTVTRKPVQVVELEDSPTFVLLSPTGKLYRQDGEAPGTIASSMRSDIGIVMSDGTAHRVHVADLPSQSSSMEVSAFLGTSKEVLGILDWNSSACYAIGTTQGVVKRFNGPLPDRDEVSLIQLREGDELVGFGIADDEALLALVSSEANLLLFEAKSVRPQGLPAAGMTGIKLEAARAIRFAVVEPTDYLVTAANDSQALGATDPGSAKVTPVSLYPKKGRATMGVRCQRFLKGEDQLYFAGFSKTEPRFLDGAEIELPAPAVDARRDGSGKPLASYLASIS